MRPSRADEIAGAREPFEDAALYDFEHRRRRADITFYRRLVADRMRFGAPGPVLDVACGTGRLLIPLLRDGHSVVGFDGSSAMLTRAAARVARLSPTRRGRCLLVRADLEAVTFRPGFAIAIAAFHSVQHVVSDAALLRLFRAVRACLGPRGWFAFDVLPPDPAFLNRDPARRWARTTFSHPVTRERLVYTTNHRLDPRRRTVHMRCYYQPVDQRGRPTAPERVVRLCHRQLAPPEVSALLRRAGFRLLACFGGFDGRSLPPGNPGLEVPEHVYLARVG